MADYYFATRYSQISIFINKVLFFGSLVIAFVAKNIQRLLFFHKVAQQRQMM